VTCRAEGGVRVISDQELPELVVMGVVTRSALNLLTPIQPHRAGQAGGVCKLGVLSQQKPVIRERNGMIVTEVSTYQGIAFRQCCDPSHKGDRLLLAPQQT
jgi:hypothetical protein